MTVLPTKSVRDSLKIDRYDRAFVWAVLALRASLISDASKKDLISNIKVAHNLYQNGEFRVLLEIRLLYDSIRFLNFGGDFALGILGFSESTITLPDTPFKANSTPTITVEPSWVNTLERYVYWNALMLLYSGHHSSKTIDIKLNEESYPSTYISISASFTLNPLLFFGGSSHVDSFFNCAPKDDTVLTVLPWVSNDSVFDNSFILSN